MPNPNCPRCENTGFTGAQWGLTATEGTGIILLACARCGCVVGCYRDPNFERDRDRVISAIATRTGVPRAQMASLAFWGG